MIIFYDNTIWNIIIRKQNYASTTRLWTIDKQETINAGHDEERRQ